MTVVFQKDVNTVTVSAGFSFLDINLGITISNLAQAEVIWDGRAGQSITTPNDFFITARLQSTTVIRLQRGGNTGAMVMHFQVIEYEEIIEILDYSSSLDTVTRELTVSFSCSTIYGEISDTVTI